MIVGYFRVKLYAIDVYLNQMKEKGIHYGRKTKGTAFSQNEF